MKLLVIGGSAGSLTVVMQLLPFLQRTWDLSVLIVFHRKDNDDHTLRDILAHRTAYEVKEIEDKDPLQAGVIYLAPADYHVLLEKDLSLSLDYSEKIHYCRPSIDVTFESAADALGPSTMALLLSGANADGVDGLVRVRNKQGVVAVQDPATAEVPFMPRKALERLPADILFDTNNLDAFITALAGFVQR